MNNIYFILIKPQMGENIGAIARVMLNFSQLNLRIVSPKKGWPNQNALITSVGAASILEKAEIFDNIDSAISDINYLYASTARIRFMNKEVVSPELAAKEIESLSVNKIGILFGPENSGLSNQDIVYANKLITIPVNHEFSSINISHACAVIAYEISKNKYGANNKEQPKLATGEEIDGLFLHLEKELDDRNFFKALDKREGMINNLRNIFMRINNFTSQDVRTMRGIIRCLAEFNEER